MPELFDPRLYDQVCFACGDRNPNGLHLKFEREADGVVCRYTPRESDQGFPGVIHGGILAALLDEAMAWALWARGRALGVTAKMETRYRRPVGLGGMLVVRGRIRAERGRRAEVEATIEAETGECLAEASGLFLRLAGEEEARVARALGWDAVP